MRRMIGVAACAVAVVATACSTSGRPTAQTRSLSAPTSSAATTPPTTTSPPPTTTTTTTTTPPPTTARSRAATTPSTTDFVPSPAEYAQALRTARTFTDEEAVGQLLMPVVEGSSADTVTSDQAADNQAVAGYRTPAEIVRAYHLGGVILTDGRPSNVDSPQQIAGLTAGLQRAATATAPHQPLLIGTDQEQGVVTRIGPPATQFPSSMALGATGSAADARLSAYDTGSELRALGVTVDFAPDADVTSGPANTAIGSRSFGSDPGAVSRLTGAAVLGYQQAGVAATAKHFPGHGDTDIDSHVSTPVLHQSRAALLADAAPFRAAVGAGAGIVMVGHLDVASVDPGMPASLSAAAVTGLLRRTLGYRGVVVTDAMNMEPVTSRYGAGDAAVHAILAGDDIALQPTSISGAYRGLLAAVHGGRLTRARVDESVARLVALRALIARHRAPALATVGSAAHRQDAARVAAGAVTVLSGRCAGRMVPAAVRVSGDSDAAGALRSALQARGVQVSGSAKTAVAVLGYGDTSAGPADIAVAADTPYPLASASAPVRIAAYSGEAASMGAVAAVLTGAAPPRGRSPVAVGTLPRTAC